MRVRLPVVISCCLAVNAVLLEAACLGPRTSILLPECADRVELSGQHRRMSDRRIELDHTFDLPLTKTELIAEKVRDGQKSKREITVVNNRPDLAHLLVGGLIGGVGTIMTVAAARDVVAEGASPLSARPFYLTLFGAPAAVGGALVMATGWHPDDETVIQGECEEAPPGAPPMPPSTLPEPPADEEISSPPRDGDR